MVRPIILVAAFASAAALACSTSDAKSARPAAAAQAQGAAAASAPRVPSDSVSTMADQGRIRGATTAPIWLIEVSDFQCPYCKQWHDESYAAIDREFVQTGKVRLAYVNYPIPSLHPNAKAASEAAMCASVQGKFWELHEALFINQAKWAKLPDPTPVFESMAIAAGVDTAKWRSCLTSHATLPLIDADHEKSERSGVQSTPMFFVGKRTIAGAYPLDTFRTVINEEIAKAKAPK